MSNPPARIELTDHSLHIAVTLHDLKPRAIITATDHATGDITARAVDPYTAMAEYSDRINAARAQRPTWTQREILQQVLTDWATEPQDDPAPPGTPAPTDQPVSAPPSRYTPSRLRLVLEVEYGRLHASVDVVEPDGRTRHGAQVPPDTAVSDYVNRSITLRRRNPDMTEGEIAAHVLLDMRAQG